MENTEFKGTKGEWKVKHLDDIFIENEFGEQICEMPANGIIKYETWRENAKLISKAPEMLEMLQLVVNDLEERGRAYGDIYTMAKQLIKEATTV